MMMIYFFQTNCVQYRYNSITEGSQFLPTTVHKYTWDAFTLYCNNFVRALYYDNIWRSVVRWDLFPPQQ